MQAVRGQKTHPATRILAWIIGYVLLAMVLSDGAGFNLDELIFYPIQMALHAGLVMIFWKLIRKLMKEIV